MPNTFGWLTLFERNSDRVTHLLPCGCWSSLDSCTMTVYGVWKCGRCHKTFTTT